jgi:hypothetical protein
MMGNNKQISMHGEPAALLMGQGRSGRSLRANILPRQDLVRTGEPPKIVVPRRQSTPQRAVFEWGRSPVRRAKAGLPTFFRCAEARPAASSGREEKRTGTEAIPEGDWRGAKKVGSRAFCGAPGKEDLNIRSSRPEIHPKPRSNGVCEAKVNGVESFHAARRAEDSVVDSVLLPAWRCTE